MQNRSRRLILNSIYSLLAWLLPVTLGLVVTPFLLKRLGVEAYGVYLVILGFIGYSFTFSLSRSVAKFVAEFKPSGDTRKINSAITAAFYISLAMGILGAVITALLAEWAVKDVLQISAEFQRPATLALMIGGASIPLIQVGQVFQNILQGSHRFGAVSVLTNLNWLFLNTGNVLLVVNGFGIDALLIWTVVVAGLIAVVSYGAAKRAEPEYGLSFSSSGEMIRPVAAYGASIFLYQIFGSLMLLFERAWVIRNFGAEVAAYYFVPMALAIFFHGFMASLTSATFPVINELLRDRDRSIQLYRKLSKLLVSLTVLFLLSVGFGAEAFLTVWIDSGFAAASFRLFIIHSFTFGSIVVMLGTWQLNEAHGAARLNALLAGVWACVTVSLMFVLADTWNAEGIAASRLIGVAVTLPVVFYAERRFLGGVQWGFWRELSFKIAAAAGVLSLIEYWVFTRNLGSWEELALGWGLGTFAYFLVLYLTGLISRDEGAVFLRAVGLGRAELE